MTTNQKTSTILFSFFTTVIVVFFLTCPTSNAQDSSENLFIDPLSRFGKSPEQLTEPKLESPTVSPTMRSAVPTDPIDPNRVDSINDRIKLLRKILADKRKASLERAEKEKRAAALEAMGKPSAPPKETETTSEQETQTGQSEERPDKFIPTIPVPKLDINNASGTPMVEEPVNSFELGNSLMKTGNYEAAIKSYKAMLARSPSANDEMWLKCLIGCCYRLQGKYAQAESKFRDLANQSKSDSYSVDYAKWSLNYIEQRRLAKAEFQNVESEMNTLLGELKNEVIKR